MKIAIQARRIFRKTKSNQDKATVNILRHIQQTDKTNQYLVYVAPGEDRCLDSSENFKIIELASSFYPIWEQLHMPRQIRKEAPDILHCTDGAAPLYMPPTCKLVLTLDNLEFLDDASSYKLNISQLLERFYLKTIVPIAVQKCKAIITGSKFENEKIQKLLNVCPSKIEVINAGVNLQGQQEGPLSREIRRKHGLPSTYILLDGEQYPDQNTSTAMEAYQKYVTMCHENKSTPTPLVVIGLHRDQLKSITHMTTWLEVKNMTTAIQHIEPQDAAQVYSNATLFLHTPLSDNSAIEALQAMAYMTPVIASSVDGTAEILGSAAMLSNPCDTTDVANKIMHLTTDQPLREQLIAKGYQQSHKYNIEEAAQKVIKLYSTLNRQS